MSPLLLKTLLSLAVILAALALSAMLRRVARRLGQQRDFARARIFQMSVVINLLLQKTVIRLNSQNSPLPADQKHCR